MADKDKETEIPVEDGKDKKNKKIEKLNAEITRLKLEVENWKNEYYRVYADMQNLRKSLEKDHQAAVKYRAEGFIDNLLPVLDSFHVVLSQEIEDPALKNYLIGFQFIYKNLVAALESEGVSELAPNIGDKFDPHTMNAVEVEETDGEEGLIVKVVTKGYKLHDRLVRPVNVVVSGKPHIEEEPVKEESAPAEEKSEEEKEDKAYDA